MSEVKTCKREQCRKLMKDMRAEAQYCSRRCKELEAQTRRREEYREYREMVQAELDKLGGDK